VRISDYVETTNNNSENLQSLTNLVERQDNAFKEYYYRALITLKSIYGNGKYRIHNTVNRKYDDNLPEFSCKEHIIRFESDENLELILLITTASQSGVFQTVTPIIQIKDLSQGDIVRTHVVRLDDWDFVTESISWDEIFESKNYSTTGNIVNTRISLRTQYEKVSEIEWKEDRKLRPVVEQWLDNEGYNYRREVNTPLGLVDIQAIKDGNVIQIELKFLNDGTSSLDQIRTAIGQILLYAYSTEQQNNTQIEKWIMFNSQSFSSELLNALKAVNQSTGIVFFHVDCNETGDVHPLF